MTLTQLALPSKLTGITAFLRACQWQISQSVHVSGEPGHVQIEINGGSREVRVSQKGLETPDISAGFEIPCRVSMAKRVRMDMKDQAAKLRGPGYSPPDRPATDSLAITTNDQDSFAARADQTCQMPDQLFRNSHDTITLAFAFADQGRTALKIDVSNVQILNLGTTQAQIQAHANYDFVADGSCLASPALAQSNFRNAPIEEAHGIGPAQKFRQAFALAAFRFRRLVRTIKPNSWPWLIARAGRTLFHGLAPKPSLGAGGQSLPGQRRGGNFILRTMGI